MSHPALNAADAAFTSALVESARGPDRDGVFALWLVVRAALGGGGAAASVNPAGHAERLRALAQRLRSLNAPAPLRRSLATAVGELASPRATPPAIVLQHLVAPAADTLGRRVADAVAAAARAVRGSRS